MSVTQTIRKTWQELFVYNENTGEYYHPTLTTFSVGTVLEIQYAYYVRGEGETEGKEYLVVVCNGQHYLANNLLGEVVVYLGCKIKKEGKRWVNILHWWEKVNLKKLPCVDVDLMDITNSYQTEKVIYVKTVDGSVHKLRKKCRAYGLLFE